MNPHLPSDEAVVAGLLLVLFAFFAIWVVEYFK